MLVNLLQKIRNLGPGLLFAGAAVGVSHLVQSTRAGADFGMGLLWATLLANFLKYPFFEFGPRYALSTGESLLEGYKKLGRWVLILYMLITFFYHVYHPNSGYCCYGQHIGFSVRVYRQHSRLEWCYHPGLYGNFINWQVCFSG